MQKNLDRETSKPKSTTNLRANPMTKAITDKEADFALQKIEEEVDILRKFVNQNRLKEESDTRPYYHEYEYRNTYPALEMKDRDLKLSLK